MRVKDIWNHKPCFFFPKLTGPTPVKQYLSVHIDQFNEPPLIPCTLNIFKSKEKTHPTKMSSLSSGLCPTEVPDNINTQQFCLGAGFREKETPFHPSQHVVLLPLVYSLFRPGLKS